MDKSKPEPDLRLLIIGAFVGLIAAGFGLLRQTPIPDVLPAEVIARINDTLIRRDHFDSAFVKPTGAVDQEAARQGAAVITQMIDEELLVQRGIALGMTQSDLTVRQAIIDSLIASITAEADAANPSDDELKQHLLANADRFSYTAKIWIEAWQTDKEPIAQTFVAQLRANDLAQLNDDIGPMSDLPAGLIPTDMASDYVGPGITAAAATMPEGSSAVFARRGRWLVIRLREKEVSTVTDIGSIRNRVLLDYRRSLAGTTLESYLENLRQQADIVVANP